MALRHLARYSCHMADAAAKALDILGGRPLLEARVKAALGKPAREKRRGVAKATEVALPRLKRRSVAEKQAAGSSVFVLGSGAHPRLEPGELAWTGIIRSGLPAKSTEKLAGSLGVSVSELSASLRLPARTLHRRLEKGEQLTPEESERSVRAARVLAKAQQLLGDENGREWVLTACRGLAGEIPITLLDTADGFTAVMDELGRLEHGVIS